MASFSPSPPTWSLTRQPAIFWPQSLPLNHTVSICWAQHKGPSGPASLMHSCCLVCVHASLTMVPVWAPSPPTWPQMSFPTEKKGLPWAKCTARSPGSLPCLIRPGLLTSYSSNLASFPTKPNSHRRQRFWWRTLPEVCTIKKGGHLTMELACRLTVPSAHCKKGGCFAAMNGDIEVSSVATLWPHCARSPGHPALGVLSPCNADCTYLPRGGGKRVPTHAAHQWLPRLFPNYMCIIYVYVHLHVYYYLLPTVIYLSIYLSTYLSIYLSFIYLSLIYLPTYSCISSINISIYPYNLASMYPFIHSFIYWSMYLPIHLSIYSVTYPPICISINHHRPFMHLCIYSQYAILGKFQRDYLKVWKSSVHLPENLEWRGSFATTKWEG